MKYRDWRTGGGYLRGVDVSAYQGTINYAKMKSNGIKFAILRAYGSGTGEDSKMVDYARGFKSVGIPCGSYFFATIGDGTNMSESTTQAYRYADKLQEVFGTGNFGELTPFIDVEYNETYGVKNSATMSNVINWVDNFRNKFESKFNNRVKLGIYASWGFINAFPTNNAIKDMPLWVAKWRTTSIANTGGFTNWVCWQYTDNAYPKSSGYEWGASSQGLDMNYVESLDDIRPISAPPVVVNVPPPIFASTPKAWLNQNDWVSVTWTKPTIKGVTRIEMWRNEGTQSGIFLGNMSLTDPQYIDKNALRGKTYTYRIKVFTKDDYKLSAPSNVITTRNPPASPPTGLTVIPYDRKIKLTWNPNPSVEGVTSYSVYQNNVKIGTTPNNSFDFIGLTNGTTYNFKVTALNGSGILSGYSATVQGTPIADSPNLPSGIAFQVKKETKEVIVSWGYIPKIDFSHFRVYVNNVLVKDNIKTNSVNMGIMSENVTHTFKVVAVDTMGDTTSSTNYDLRFDVPAKVVNFKATPKSTSVGLRWDFVTTDNATPPNVLQVKNYLIYQDGYLVKTVDFTTSLVEITNLIEGQTYSFYVQALSEDDILGQPSDPITVTTVKVLPNQPTNLQAPIINQKTIKFSFEHTENENFDYYEALVNGSQIPLDEELKEYIYNEAKPNFDYTFKVIVHDKDGDTIESGTITTRINVPKIPVGLTVTTKDREASLIWQLNQETFDTKYNLYMNDEKIAEIPVGVSTYKVENLLNNVGYSFQLEAVSDMGFVSEKSEYVVATPQIVIPNKPKIIMHREIDNDSVELIWEHETKELHSHYNLYRDGFLFAKDIKVKSYITDYLEKNVTHSFQVEAVDLQGDKSGFSDSYYITIYSNYFEPLTIEIGKISENVETPKPKLYLCKPNKTTIAYMGEAYQIAYETRLADLNEITFRIPYYIDISSDLQITPYSENIVDNFLIKTPYYENVRERFLVRLEYNNHIEYFIINEIRNDSESNGKEIHAFSLGYELKDKTINSIKEEIYTCYNAFEKALEGQVNWQVGANIKNFDFYWNRESRKFDVTGETILDFIIQIAKSYNAILVWDTVNRIVDLQNPLINPINKGLKIKYGKYLKSLSKTSSIDELVTRLVPVGENNLNIRSVTPNGDNALEDFSFFMQGYDQEKGTHSPYMSDELCQAILDYQVLIKDNELTLQNYLADIRTKNEELMELELELEEKEANLTFVEKLLASIKAEGSLFNDLVTYGGTPKPISHDLFKDYKYMLMAKTDIVGDINVTSNYQGKNNTFTFPHNSWFIVEKISFDRTGETTEERAVKNYPYKLTITGTTACQMEFRTIRILTEEFDTVGNESELLAKYNESIAKEERDAQLSLVNNKKNEISIIEGNISVLNDSLLIENNLSPELLAERDLFVITKEFVDEKISNPEDLKNRAIEKFKELKSPVVTIEINMVNFLEVLEEHQNWQKLELGTIINIFYEKFGIDISARIINIDYNFSDKTISLKISNVKDLKSNQEKFVNALYGAVSTSNKVSLEKSQWTLGGQAYVNFESFVNKEFDATKQKIIAGTDESVEISRRGLLIKSDTNPNNMLVANASVLAITKDGGISYKNAITTDGIIGERIIGKIIAGEELTIENSAGNFRVDKDGVTIQNQALNIIGGITKEQLSSDINFNTDLSGISSKYEDTYDDNNTNATIPTAPTILTDGTQIQYSDVNTGVVNISFEWQFEETGYESDIDGFMIYLYTSSSSAPYIFGTNPKVELRYYVADYKRSIILYNVPKDMYYNFGVESYRMVNTDIASSGTLKSVIVQTTVPYNPKYNVAYTGDILGTIAQNTTTRVSDSLINAIRQGQPYNNVVIDTVNGFVATNNADTERTIINSSGFRIQTKVGGAGYSDVLYANAQGQLVAEDLLANRLIVNDGSGRELINAKTKQINFANFDVVTGQIQATNVNMKGMTVTNTGGTTTFSIDENGNASISGNITMQGGSISWANLNKPTYTAEEVGARPDTWLPTASEIGARPVGWLPTAEEIGAREDDWLPTAEEIMAKPVGWFPTYDEVIGTIGVTKPPANANNTFNELTNNGNIRGFFNSNGILYLNADFIQAGKMRATYLDVKGYLTVTDNLGNVTLAIDSLGNLSMKGTLNGATGTFTGELVGGSISANTDINVTEDIYVGQNIYMQYDYDNRFNEKGLVLYDGIGFHGANPTFDCRIIGTYLKMELICPNRIELKTQHAIIGGGELWVSSTFSSTNSASFSGSVDFTGATVTGLVAKFG